MNSQKNVSTLEGLVVDSEFEGRPARVRHDAVSRTENMKLRMTNEIFPYRPVRDHKVDTRSKITFKLAERQEWVDRFREMMGEYMLGQFATPGYGWMDTNHDADEYKFSLLQCGGNLVNVVALDGRHAYVETQDFYKTPNPNLTYRHTPHLTIKQVLVGRSAEQRIYWIVDKKRGDITFPAVSSVQAAIPLEQLEFFPELPWTTKMIKDHLPIIVTAYWFVGSNTYGLVDNMWQLLEEMPITRKGSHLDRQVNVENWIETCPPPVIGWTRGLE